jgi:hypothetical protein
MTDFPISRRAMLGAIGAVGVAGAALTLRKTGRDAAGLALIDAELSGVDRLLARSMARGRRLRQLKGDLVWQWRRELRDRLAASGGAVALVRWDKAMVLAGLAREAGIATRQKQISRSLFRIDLG